MRGSYKPLAVPQGWVPPPKAGKVGQLTLAPSGITEAAGGDGAGTQFPRTLGHHCKEVQGTRVASDWAGTSGRSAMHPSSGSLNSSKH